MYNAQVKMVYLRLSFNDGGRVTHTIREEGFNIVRFSPFIFSRSRSTILVSFCICYIYILNIVSNF